MKKTLRFFLAAAAVGLFGLTGCDQHQERYEDPPWLGGSSIETLEERGNYTIFLKLMEKANYADPIAKQLFTLFVPDDDAFGEYFASAGINSVDDLTEDEAVQLFTLHVLRNPRSRYYLVYEFVWEEFQGPKGEYASLYHRKETPSTSIPYFETVRYVPGMEGRELLMMTGNKHVPLWSSEWFGDYGGTLDGSDYLFMYPGSTWELNYTPNLKGLNWHNAMVIPNPEIPDELEVRTASGFIYFLDRVVPPLPSIDEFMFMHPEKYGLYYDILQRFAIYNAAGIDEDRRVLYQKTYDLVFDLASERASPQNRDAPPYQYMYTAFLPPNELLQDYLDQTVMQYYSSIDSVPRITLYYILQTQLSASLVLKSKIANGYFNAFGDPTDLTADDLVSDYMCSNGVIYESKRVLEPNVFITVPGILFFDKNYSTLLYVLEAADMLSVVSNPDADVTLFATTNEKLEEYGIRYNATRDVVEFRGPIDGVWSPMKTTDLVMFGQDQIYQGRLSDFSGEGAYVEMISGNFIKYNDNQVAAGENQAKDVYADVQEIMENELNGYLVKVDDPVMSRIVMGQVLTCAPTEPNCALADPEFSAFSKILVDLKLLDDRYKDPVTKENIPNLKFLAAADYWTAFIPSNAAVEQARLEGIIPTYGKISDLTTGQKDSLSNLVKYHFLIDNVVFDDGVKSGIFKTNYTYKDPADGSTVSATVNITNTPDNLFIEDATGQVIYLDHAKANTLVRKGVVHKIDAVLKYAE